MDIALFVREISGKEEKKNQIKSGKPSGAADKISDKVKLNPDGKVTLTDEGKVAAAQQKK